MEEIASVLHPSLRSESFSLKLCKVPSQDLLGATSRDLLRISVDLFLSSPRGSDI